MATEVLDGNSIRKAANVVSAGGDLVLRDKLAPGLAIRIQRGSASWSLITRETKISIAPLGTFGKDDLPLLRELVGKARSMLREGKDPKPLFRAAVTERDAAAAGARADTVAGRAMVWETMRDKYLEWAAKNRRPDTHRGYRSALGAIEGSPIAEDFRPIFGKPVTLLTTHDLRLVRNRITKRGQDENGRQVSNVRQAALTVAALKAAFGWAVENFETTGLTSNPAFELRAPEKSKDNAHDDDHRADNDRRALTLAEIGTIVLSLDTYPNHAARLALMIQLMTGQRRKTVVQARKSRFQETPDFGLLWRIGPDKSGKYRVIPLPDLAASAVRAAMGASRADSPWLFPQQRLRRAGDAGDAHMAERMLNEILEVFRKPGGPLASIPWVSTHDLRKAFVTHMSRRLKPLDLPKDAVSLITRGDEGRMGLDETTYDLDVRLPEKWTLLCEWDQLVKQGCEEAEAILTSRAA